MVRHTRAPNDSGYAGSPTRPAGNGLGRGRHASKGERFEISLTYMLYFRPRNVKFVAVTVAMDIEYNPLTELPRQDALLRALLPGLAALEQTHGVWLTGSLARGDADRWSSVDLHLLWRPERLGPAGQAKPSLVVQKCVRETFGDENVHIEQIRDSESGGSLQGICLGTHSAVDRWNDPDPAGVLFELSWTLSTDHSKIVGPAGATHPLYISELTADAYEVAPVNRRAAIGLPDVEAVDRLLGRFWLLLARLPAVVGRQEQLAAHLLLTEMCTLLVDLVVSLNGASRPQTKARINQYLGLAQREAFEKSLGLRKAVRQREASNSANWIGQAVALIVLYRWYAPQLTEKYSLTYPRLAEDCVLAYLKAELKNWPAHITTG